MFDEFALQVALVAASLLTRVMVVMSFVFKKLFKIFLIQFKSTFDKTEYTRIWRHVQRVTGTRSTDR